MFARSIILLSSALLTTTASPVAQDDCNIQSGTCPIEDSPIPDWVKKLNDPNSGPYKGSLDTADILPCKDLTQCMGDSSPLMESATQYYGFKGCSASQKRALVQMQADAIRIVRSVANYDLDWDRDEALLEFFGPAESTLKSTCRKRIPGQC